MNLSKSYVTTVVVFQIIHSFVGHGDILHHGYLVNELNLRVSDRVDHHFLREATAIIEDMHS